ncbi:MAG TPA: 50S ribosomal protein L13 [Candidatus Kaiserbacteria bacterium]|nr:50S ribosomal protein L13 [Candidatus Kaiserbacteria bacterium]
MEKKNEMKKYNIDATGRTLGRVASEAASVLIGKNSTEFIKYRILPVQVTVKNAKKLLILERRMKKIYTHYTGYPGGLRTTTMKSLIEKKGIDEVLRRAVYGMIPHNKLRKERMKNLIITD